MPRRATVLKAIPAAALVALLAASARTEDGPKADPRTIVVDHACTKLEAIPAKWVEEAKKTLHVAYGHTSHGSQLVTGMTGLLKYKPGYDRTYAFGNGGKDGALDLRDRPFSGANDLGNPDRTAWEAATRAYLKAHPETNVVVWSWCGQAGNAKEGDIETYLRLMGGLETDWPKVKFVYMTGHLDGSGLRGNLHARNEQIRAHCRRGGRILFDFEDIESHDPDGVSYAERAPNDACDYDKDGDGRRESNWAKEWQEAHPGKWFPCSSAHSQPLNANLKAQAAWHLWARLAGWDGK
ncbi:MAG: hypothetical protein HYY18_14960 [Planctomycetes bacterium]|nr:hypothetical protein [Planctomycetota bacterium]